MSASTSTRSRHLEREVTIDGGPEIGELLGRYELEDIVRLGLTHQLSNEVCASIGIRFAQRSLELVKGHVHIPEEVGTPLRVDHAVARCRCEHDEKSTRTGVPSETNLERCSRERSFVHEYSDQEGLATNAPGPGVPNGIRNRVGSVKGSCPRPPNPRASAVRRSSASEGVPYPMCARRAPAP